MARKRIASRTRSSVVMSVLKPSSKSVTLLLMHMLLLSPLGHAAESESSAKIRFDVAIQPLDAALAAIAKQSGLKILVEVDVSKRVASTALQDLYTVDAALSRLLEPQGLKAERNASGVIVVRDASSAARVAMPSSPASADGSNAPISEILVTGRRVLNVDIRRTEDDVQPYVVIDREEIKNSSAENLEQFLRSRLAMNTAQGSMAQSGGQADNPARSVSSFNLRGLGSNQTLVLIDGRRVAGVSINGDVTSQPDLNGIPLSAVERIEILPSTAGGIYGGGATGGVINVILRRDFNGLEATVVYGNVFKGSAATKRIDLNGGFSLNDGRTRVTATFSHAEQGGLLQGDRDFTRRAAALKERNNPTDPASSIRPPIGATPNIQSSDGSPLTLDDGRALNSNITHIPMGYAGPASDGGRALLDNAGRFNLNLPNDLNGLKRGLMASPTVDSLMASVRHEFTRDAVGFVDLSATRNMGRTRALLAMPGYVRRLSADAPNNPFQQDIDVSFPSPQLNFLQKSLTEQQRATAGLIFRLPANWSAGADIAWSRSRQTDTGSSFALDTGATFGSEFYSPDLGIPRGTLGTGLPGPALPGQSGTRPALNVLQEQNTFPLDYSPYLMPSPNAISGPSDVVSRSATLRIGGPVWTLPAGPMMVSGVIERSKQRGLESISRLIDNATREAKYTVRPSTSEEISSYYAEVNAPLFSEKTGTSGLRGLDLQLSARSDNYKTTGTADFFRDLASPDAARPSANYQQSNTTSTAYTVGLRYKPVNSLMARVSAGTGFLPPNVNQLSPTTNTAPNVLGLVDRQRPVRDASGAVIGYEQLGASGSELLEFRIGGNPNLQPERSRSLSAGFVFTPESLPELRVSVDYTRITKSQEILPIEEQFILDNEALYPGRVKRGPKLPTDPADWAGPVTGLDSSLLNIASSRVEALDLSVNYGFKTSVGDFRLSSMVTRQTHLTRRFVPTSPTVELVGKDGGPLAWRGNFGLNWERGPWMLGWNVQYYHSYKVCGAVEFDCATVERNQGSDRIPSQVYHDFLARYQFGPRQGPFGSLLKDGEISLGIQNVFNTSPPIVVDHFNPNDPGNGYSLYGDPRLRRFLVSFKKSFK